MSRHSPVQYDRSSDLASTPEAGPSRLPNFSQILLDMKDMPLSDDQFSSNEQNTPKITTTTGKRSDNPAAVLRALLSRLPAHPPSPTKSLLDSHHNGPNVISDCSTTSSPLTPTRNKSSRRLKSDLTTPSSSDESENWSYRNIQSGSKWMATPKPPGGWLNTPKPSREVTEQGSPGDDATKRNGDILLAADGLSYLKTPARAEATHGSQSSAKTPKPPGGWVSTPAPALIPAQLWLASPDVKKSVLKVRFEPEVSTFTDKLESGKHPDPSFDSSISGVNGLDDGDDGLQRTEELSSKSPPSPRRQKSPKTPKIRVLDAFGREQDTEAATTPSYSTVSRGELLSRIRNGLDDLVVGIDDLDR